MNHIYTSNKESGVVSLLTVMFFTVLTLVVTLGFVRLMLIEQRQATDDNLSNMAKAAAESGIEDAKRAILKYDSLPIGSPERITYEGLLNNPTCNALNSSGMVQTDLGLDPNGTVAEGQRYSCLTVRLNTTEFKGPAQKDGKVIPLKSVSPFDRIQVSWHLISDDSRPGDGDGTPANYWNQDTLPKAGDLAATDSPALLRVQLFSYATGALNRNAISDSNRSVTLIPSNAGAASFDISAEDPKSGWSSPVSATAKNGVRQVSCNPSPSGADIGSYACSTTILLGSLPLPSAGHNYFLKVTPLYTDKGSHYEVRLMDGPTTSVQFDGVQPIIDSTGQVTDVYRRLQARVMFDSFMAPPDNALETAQDLCKTMRIAQPAEYLANNCS